MPRRSPRSAKKAPSRRAVRDSSRKWPGAAQECRPKPCNPDDALGSPRSPPVQPEPAPQSPAGRFPCGRCGVPQLPARGRGSARPSHGRLRYRPCGPRVSNSRFASAHYAAARPKSNAEHRRGCEAPRRNSAIMRPSTIRTSSREFPMDEILRMSALEYHLRQPPGKISVIPMMVLLNQRDLDKLVEIIAALEPTFGGINLEDIKAPECFHIESRLRERMKIPVFHDDQHGTAIIVGAAVLNGLRVVGKDIAKAKLVCSGAGAAALACLDLLVSLGLNPDNIWVSDIEGVVYQGRKEEMDPNKARYARKTSARTLAEIMPGADVFLGLSAGGVLKAEMVAKMADKPLILALANPEPEILPEFRKSG